MHGHRRAATLPAGPAPPRAGEAGIAGVTASSARCITDASQVQLTGTRMGGPGFASTAAGPRRGRSGCCSGASPRSRARSPGPHRLTILRHLRAGFRHRAGDFCPYRLCPAPPGSPAERGSSSVRARTSPRRERSDHRSRRSPWTTRGREGKPAAGGPRGRTPSGAWCHRCASDRLVRRPSISSGSARCRGRAPSSSSTGSAEY
jgi:hypothetical protein